MEQYHNDDDDDNWSDVEYASGYTSMEQRQLLLPFVDNTLSAAEEESSKSWADDEGSSSRSSSSSMSSHQSSLSSKPSTTNTTTLDHHEDKKIILQLSPSGGLEPLPVNTSKDTHSTSTFSDDTSSPKQSATSDTPSFYQVQWDLTPLWKEVADHGVLLPLHIACLFRANPDAVATLVQAFPLAALSDVLGMLPIHWVAAGWTVPPIAVPPSSSSPNSLHLSFDDLKDPLSGPMATLHVLRRTLPECLSIRSGNHGMLASDYVQECMVEDSDYKDLCLRVLSDGIEYLVAYGSMTCSSQDTIVFCDTDETSGYGGDGGGTTSSSHYPSPHLFMGLSALILDEEWTKAITVIQQDPGSVRKWYYGVEKDTVGTNVWKRLPIHLACANGAPYDVIDLLLQVSPESCLMEDPHDGSLPLHIACRASDTALSVIERLVTECPEVILAVDGGGRVPLHVAVLAQAPLPVIEYLLIQEVESVVALDKDGKTPLDYAIVLDETNTYGPVVDLLTTTLLQLEVGGGAKQNHLKKRSSTTKSDE
jgi:hypothetical protein